MKGYNDASGNTLLFDKYKTCINLFNVLLDDNVCMLDWNYPRLTDSNLRAMFKPLRDYRNTRVRTRVLLGY